MSRGTFIVDNERAFASRPAGSAAALRVHYAPLEKRFEEALRRYGR